MHQDKAFGRKPRPSLICESAGEGGSGRDDRRGARDIPQMPQEL